MRIVVVGGGVIGLLTAMECVRAGARVDLVDSGGLPSPSATSNDLTRVVRALHRGDAALTLAAARAHRGWLEVERRVGGRFYHRVGVLTAMPAADVAANHAIVTATGLPAKVVTAAELGERYPQINFGPGRAAVFEPAAGAVLARQALLALVGWLRDQSAVHLHPHRAVVAVDGAGGVPLADGTAGVRLAGGTAGVRLADGTALTGDCVVVAAGPWSRGLVPANLATDLAMQRQTMLSYATTWTGMPAVLGLGLGERCDAWLMPPLAGRPARLSAASACRTVPEMTDRVAPRRWRDHLIDRFATLLAGFDPAAVTGAADGYYLTDAASGGPLLAGDGRVWIYAACGGMSFKFAPLIARALADRAVGRTARRTGLEPVDHPRPLTAHVWRRTHEAART
jgi:glycine/D-amino acid oxidase-like deaminating enzyme